MNSSGYGRYPIEIWWKDYGKQQPLQLSIDYQLQFFSAEEMELVAQRLLFILKQFSTQLDSKSSEIEIIPPSELQILERFNDVSVAYPDTKNLVEIFNEHVVATPEAIALQLEDQQYSYQELNEKANQLAHYLQAKGVSTDTLVPVCFDRSLDMVVGILGIMKAGAAYVPIDPGYPEDRISYMLEDTGAKIVVTNHALAEKFAPAIDLIQLDTDAKTIAAQSVLNPTNKIHASDMSYVIYTSGSTGKPKGVMVEHGGMLNHLYSKVNDLELNRSSIVAFTASYTFDISVWQLFSAMLCGGTTIIYTSVLILQPAELIRAIDKDKVTIWEVVPSYLAAVLQEQFVASLTALKYLLVTGEAVSQPVLALWFEHAFYGRIPVVNAYGPTEASDDICHYIMHETPGSANVPLGSPIQNTQLYVVNNDMRLCPIGVAGEIGVSGICVFKRLLNRPDLTAENLLNILLIPLLSTACTVPEILADGCQMVISNILAVLTIRLKSEVSVLSWVR